MSAALTVHDIGRAGDPTATTYTTHASVDAARASLVARYGVDQIRGLDRDNGTAGTVGSLNGRVFQASKSWSIR